MADNEKARREPKLCTCGAPPAEAKSKGRYVLFCLNPSCHRQPVAAGSCRGEALDYWDSKIEEARKKCK